MRVVHLNQQELLYMRLPAISLSQIFTIIAAYKSAKTAREAGVLGYLFYRSPIDPLITGAECVLADIPPGTENLPGFMARGLARLVFEFKKGDLAAETACDDLKHILGPHYDSFIEHKVILKGYRGNDLMFPEADLVRFAAFRTALSPIIARINSNTHPCYKIMPEQEAVFTRLASFNYQYPLALLYDLIYAVKTKDPKETGPTERFFQPYIRQAEELLTLINSFSPLSISPGSSGYVGSRYLLGLYASLFDLIDEGDPSIKRGVVEVLRRVFESIRGPYFKLIDEAITSKTGRRLQDKDAFFIGLESQYRELSTRLAALSNSEATEDIARQISEIKQAQQALYAKSQEVRELYNLRNLLSFRASSSGASLSEECYELRRTTIKIQSLLPSAAALPAFLGNDDVPVTAAGAGAAAAASAVTRSDADPSPVVAAGVGEAQVYPDSDPRLEATAAAAPGPSSIASAHPAVSCHAGAGAPLPVTGVTRTAPPIAPILTAHGLYAADPVAGSEPGAVAAAGTIEAREERGSRSQLGSA